MTEKERKHALLTYALERKSEGWRIVLVPENQKKGGACSKGWSTRELTKEEITDHVNNGGNIGGVPPETVALIDVDKHGEVDGDVTLKELIQEFNLPKLPVLTRTPTSGSHIAIRVPEYAIPHLQEYIAFRPGLDLIYKTKFIILPWCMRDDGKVRGAYIQISEYKPIEIDNKDFWRMLCSKKTKKRKTTPENEWDEGNRHDTLVAKSWQIVSSISNPEKRNEALDALRLEAKEKGKRPKDEIDDAINSAIAKRDKQDLYLREVTGNSPDTNIKPHFDIAVKEACLRLFRVKRDDICMVKTANGYRTLIWDENKWTYDNDLLLSTIYRNEEVIYKAFVERGWAEIGDTWKYLNNLLNQNKTENIAKNLPRVYLNVRNSPFGKMLREIKDTDINRHDDYIIFTNCAINLTTDKEIPIEKTKNFYSTINIGYPFDWDAKSELVDKLLIGKVDYFRALARSLKGGPDRNFGVVIGNSGTGKTTFSEIVDRALGDYSAISMLEFLSKHNNPNSPDTHLVRLLQGARLVFGSDTAGFTQMSPANIKRYVGSEIVSARDMHSKSQEYRVNFTLFLSENEIPYTGIARDDAIEARIKYVRCEAFGEDGELTKKQIATLKNDVKHKQALMLQMILLATGKEEDYWPDQTDFLQEAREMEYPEFIADIVRNFEFNVDAKTVPKKERHCTNQADLWEQIRVFLDADKKKLKRRSVMIYVTRYIKHTFNIEITRSNGKKYWEGLKIIPKSEFD